MTMIKGMPAHGTSMQLCVNKLRLFVEDTDQNLKYLGLLALGEIVKEHPKLIQPLRDMVATLSPNPWLTPGYSILVYLR